MNTYPNEPLSPEERDLAQRLARVGPHGEPSSALDAKILAAAHDAVASTRSPSRKPARKRWPLALGLAASLTLAVGIAWQLRPMPEAGVEYSEAPAAAASDAAADAIAEPALEAEVAAADAAASIEPAKPAETRVLPPPTGNTEAKQAVVGKTSAPPPPASEEPPIVFDEPARADALADKPVMQAAPLPSPPESDEFVAAPPPAPAASAAPAAAAGGAMTRQATQAFGASERAKPEASRRAEYKTTAAEADSDAQLDRVEVSGSRVRQTNTHDQPLDDQPPASADSPEVRQAWLQRIRELLARGETDAARTSLQEFKRRYPNVAVPEDLRKLAP